jgi:hypothetical protein
LTTVLLITLILSWTFKKLARRIFSRCKRGAREHREDAVFTCAGRDDTPIVNGQHPEPVEKPIVHREEEANPLDPQIKILEAQLAEKESKLAEKESKLAAKTSENVRLKKALTKLKERNRDRKENVKKYQEKNKEVRKENKASSTGSEGHEKKGKRSGKPVGSNGGGFSLPPNVKPDRTKHWYLKGCTHCNANFEGRKPINKWDHFIVDIERTPSGKGLEIVITKHVVHRYRCPDCGKLVHKNFGPLKNMHYGLGFIAYVLADRTNRKGTWDGISFSLYQIIKDETFIPTIKTFIDWMKKIYPEVKEACTVLKACLKKEKHAHVDETGLPKDGDNWWLWVIASAHVVLYINSPTRGHVAVKDIFEEFNGVLISDFWSAYNKLTVEQQKCLAHLVKTLKELEHESVKKGGEIKKVLEKDDELRQQTSLGSKSGRPKKQPEPLSDAKRDELEAEKGMHDKAFQQFKRIHEFLNQAWGDGEMGYKAPMKSRISPGEAVVRMQEEVIDVIRAEGVANDDVKRVLNRCEKFAGQFFTYLAHEGIPPDNNMAERMLRPFVIQRKLSQNFINETVMDSQVGLYSLLQTAKLNGGDFIEVLDAVLRGKRDLVIKHLGISDLVPRPPPDPDNPDLGDASST